MPPEPIPPSPLRKGAEVEVQLDKLAFGGQALGRVEGMVVFVDHGLPGQRVLVRLTKKKSQFAEARVLEVLDQSPAYTPPVCGHFGLCGGCQWQDLDYAEQLRWKGLHVQESLRHLAGLDPEVILPPLASPQTRFYRNKMEFTFAPRRWLSPAELEAGVDPYAGGLALGLHARGGFDRVFDLTECYLQAPWTADLVQTVRDYCRESHQPAYHTREHRGFWRFLVLREGKHTGQALVHLITTATGDPAAVDRLGAVLKERFPALTTLVHSVSQRKAQVASGESARVLWGPGHIEEELDGRRFRISPHSFFQTNTAGAQLIYRTVAAQAELSGAETVWDLYCGTGSIAVYLASRAARVVGLELVEEAVHDAYVNAELNRLDNCRFLAGDLKDLLRGAGGRPLGPPPDVIVTDPPRAGMHPQVVQALRQLAPRRLVAVSCNPASLARDLALLQDLYTLRAVQPVDLFPHTAHIECVARLDRRP